MPPASDRSPSLTSPSPGRRILSRIKSPFGTKSRTVVDFHIEPDHPHKQYLPGDVVTGSVFLQIARPIRVTHVVVSLSGYAQVYKNPGSPGEGHRGTAGQPSTTGGKKHGEYFGNGFATLFEDEVVLCGDGKLGEGTYQFNFELEFPDSDLPSSIDFERGTISYLITATMTRPTAISPTLTCERKVYFVERIEISPLYPPKPRTITLEAVSRRSRAKHQAKKLVDQADPRTRKTDSGSQSDAIQDGQSVVAPESVSARSPSLSEVSYDSETSGFRRVSQAESGLASPTSGSNPNGSQSKTSLGSNKTITVDIESCVGGCLRGDNLPVKVTINHTKHIKSMNGIIVTLYRLARVDMHPVIPLGPTPKSGKPKYEDYYPRSMTGLGGLSLSGGGSSHTFRKDLAQTVQPLIVNPNSLTSEMTVKVRVPEDAFPTISTVPGAMIGFKYYLEVIVDISGKLSTTGNTIGNLGGLASATLAGADEYSGERNGLASFGSNMLDTTPIRRDKSVVSCSFEVVIGTQDSERRKGKKKADLPAPVEETLQTTDQPVSAVTPQTSAAREVHENGDVTSEAYWHEGDQRDWSHGDQHLYDYAYYQDGAYDALPAVPMPNLPDESQLSEKERMRLAEQRLLPSHPPGIEEQAEAGALDDATAPYLPETLDGQRYGFQPNVEAGPSSRPVCDSTQESASNHADIAILDPAPAYIAPRPNTSHTNSLAGTDDRQELQRRRLEQEASAPPPPDDDDDDERGQPSHHLAGVVPIGEDASPVPQPQASRDSHAGADAVVDLPRYER